MSFSKHLEKKTKSFPDFPNQILLSEALHWKTERFKGSKRTIISYKNGHSCPSNFLVIYDSCHSPPPHQTPPATSPEMTSSSTAAAAIQSASSSTLSPHAAPFALPVRPARAPLQDGNNLPSSSSSSSSTLFLIVSHAPPPRVLRLVRRVLPLPDDRHRRFGARGGGGGLCEGSGLCVWFIRVKCVRSEVFRFSVGRI